MINITLEEANKILNEQSNGCIEEISPGKGGRAWLSGEFQLCELEALCVKIRSIAGDNAEGAEELINYWKNEKI